MKKNYGTEICILTGGLSSRMGRNKSKLRLGGKTLLATIRKTATSLRLPVRVIDRDLVPRCGPLGGIYTALKTTSAETILFLACDMPQVSRALLEKILQYSQTDCDAIFSWSKDVAGFPFVLNLRTISIVEMLLGKKEFSLKGLAKETHAKKFRPGHLFKSDLLNVNTPADWIDLKTTFVEKG